MRHPVSRRRFLAALPAVAAVTATARGARATTTDIAALGHLDPPGVTLLDAARGTVLANLPLAHEPAQLLIDGGGRRLLASDYEDGLSLVPLDDEPRPRYLPLPFMPVHMQAAPGGELLAINGMIEEGMWLLDPERPDDARRIRGLVEPHNFRFDRGGRRLLVADRGGRGLAVVDVARAERVAELGTGATAAMPADAVPDGLAVTPDQRIVLLVFDGAERTVWLSRETGEVGVGPALGGRPDRPRVERRGRFFLVELPESGELLLLAARRPAILARIPLGGEALLAQLWFDRILALAARGGSDLLLFDLEELRAVARLALPGAVGGLVAAPAGNRLFLLLDGPPRILALRLPGRETTLLAPLPAATAMAVTEGSTTFCS